MALGLRAFAAMALAGGVVAGGLALARGLDMNLPIFGPTPGEFHPGAAVPWRAPGVEPPPAAEPRARASFGFGYGKPVCVRLCDGYFFPAASLSGGQAACAAECPDAPTALYTMPTDRIDDAISQDGAPYTALPVANRYLALRDNTCACRRDTIAASAGREIMADTTLRKGDVVMTPQGFRVYEGGGYGPSGPQDFVALSEARLPSAERAALIAMEGASAGSPKLAAPARVVARPPGDVSVENGRPGR